MGCEEAWRALRRGARLGIIFLDGCGDRRRRGLLPGADNEKLRLKIRQTLYQTACFVCRTSSQRMCETLSSARPSSFAVSLTGWLLPQIHTGSCFGPAYVCAAAFVPAFSV